VAHKILQNAVDALALGSLYALFALGIALIFGIMGLINFAHGDLIMLGGFSIVLMKRLPLGLSIAITIVGVVVIALAVERMAFRPVRRSDPSTMLITSFAVSFFLQNAVVMIFGTLPRSADISGGLIKTIEVGGITVQMLDLVTVVTTVVLLIGLGLFLGRTRLGTQMRAAAEDFTMARILGVRANAVIATAFVLSGVLAAVASIFITTRAGIVDSRAGSTPVLVAFIATVLGGLGSLRGAVLGGLLLGALTVTLQTFLPVDLRYYRDAFAYGGVIVLLLLRPQGLFAPAHAKARI
jgi:branched-chain amino acid transport system permease protein